MIMKIVKLAQATYLYWTKIVSILQLILNYSIIVSTLRK